MIDKTSLDSIEVLHRMKAEGIITEEEFEQSKQRILFGSGSKTTAGATTATGNDHLAWILLPIRRYAEFTGRSSRKEFWMFQLVYVALFVVGSVLIGGTMDSYGEFSPFGNVVLGLIILALLGLFVPLLAVEVRRFHDQNRSGWFVLLNLIPYVGVIIVFVMMLLEGTQGDNRFGPDPRT